MISNVESPSYGLSEDTNTAIRAIGVSPTTCKSVSRRKLQSHSRSSVYSYASKGSSSSAAAKHADVFLGAVGSGRVEMPNLLQLQMYVMGFEKVTRRHV